VDPFDYHASEVRVRFGPGRRTEAAAAVEALGGQRALLLTTPGRAEFAADVTAALGDRCRAVFSEARMHTPVEVTEAAMEVVEREGIDCLVAIGGGSTIGLGKAIALRTDLPQVAVPTTYAGSEMTDILGETRDGAKTTQRSPKVRPEIVIYDVELTAGMPPALSATSGMNAVAHAVEALYAPDGNPVITLMAEEGVRALVSALPAVVDDPADMAARGDALYGAWLCATCLGAVSMALHHKLCHVLGGSFGLPHAETHTVVLPYAVAYNAPAAPAAMARLARALGADDPVAALHALGARLGTPRSLAEIGMPESGIDRAVETALASPYANPRPLEPEPLRALLTAAWSGRPPRS
jgi:maleylacetate reductase